MDEQKIQSYRDHPIPKKKRQTGEKTWGCFGSIFSHRKQTPPRSNGIYGKPDEWPQQGFNSRPAAVYPMTSRFPQKPQDQHPTNLEIAYDMHERNSRWQQQCGANEAPSHHFSSARATKPVVARRPVKLDTIQTVAAADGEVSPLTENDSTIASPGPVSRRGLGAELWTVENRPSRQESKASRATEGLKANEPWQGWD